MKILVSGYSSVIVSELVELLEIDNRSIQICKVGRGEGSDIFCDFADFDSVKNFINNELTSSDFSGVFLNHGILFGKKASSISIQELNNYMMVNCFSFLLILEALAKLKNINVVVMSSISAKEGSYDPIYAATKAGVDSYRVRATKDFNESSRLNFISPGIISDARMTTLRKDIENVDLAAMRTPTKNLTTSVEVARLAKYLLLEPGNLHCQDFGINGGLST